MTSAIEAGNLTEAVLDDNVSPSLSTTSVAEPGIQDFASSRAAITPSCNLVGPDSNAAYIGRPSRAFAMTALSGVSVRTVFASV